MRVYPEDIKQAVEQSRAIAEASKRLIEPAKPVQSPLDARWQSVQRQRSRQQ